MFHFSVPSLRSFSCFCGLEGCSKSLKPYCGFQVLMCISPVFLNVFCTVSISLFLLLFIVSHIWVCLGELVLCVPVKQVYRAEGGCTFIYNPWRIFFLVEYDFLIGCLIMST